MFMGLLVAIACTTNVNTIKTFLTLDFLFFTANQEKKSME